MEIGSDLRETIMSAKTARGQYNGQAAIIVLIFALGLVALISAFGIRIDGKPYAIAPIIPFWVGLGMIAIAGLWLWFLSAVIDKR